jgi:hypothetical protein
MADPDDDPLEEMFARARDRAERFQLWLEQLPSGDPGFAAASALYPLDMSEWQAAMYLLTGCEGVCGALGADVLVDRSIAPVVRELEQPRRPWASSENAIMQWACHFWSGTWTAGRPSSPTCSSSSTSTSSRRAICANASRPRSRSPMLGHEA